MKMGIAMSDIVTTVSKTYAEEIKTAEFGEGLDYVMRMNGDDLYGIVNGISYKDNDPATDNRIYKNYTYKGLSGKYENKRRLQEEMELPQKKEVPVIGLVSRLVDQKGLDLIALVIEQLMEDDLQFIILGTGNEKYEELFRKLASSYPDKIAANGR